MFKFLNNSWCISIFSGFIVFFITKYIFSVREKKEHSQLLNLLNSKLDKKMDKKVITDIVKTNGYISTFKSNGVLRTVIRDEHGIIQEII